MNAQRYHAFWIYVVSVLQLVVCSEDVIVNIKQGTLKGEKLTTANGNTYFAFSGIPFAKPPVGDLRFRRPVEPEPWKVVRDARNEGSICSQPDRMNPGTIIGQEDCLFINVNTPQLERASEGGKPVMVYIHGGAFVVGSGSRTRLGEGRLIDQDVILVTLNYRLHVYGFLSTEDEAASGNYGLWDQVMALRWVRDNIREFGGDPGRVTIFGESAGAMSVSLLVVYPHAAGLFHAAIMQSGAATCAWSTREDSQLIAHKLAEVVGCSTVTTALLVDCLRKKSEQDLTTGFMELSSDPDLRSRSLLSFGPVLEHIKDGFMTECPTRRLKRGEFNKVPVIGGVMENEGGMFYTPASDDITLEEQIERIVEDHTDTSNVTEFKEAVARGYLNDVDITDVKSKHQVMQLILSDAMFAGCGEQFMTILAGHGVPAYMYMMSYKGENTVSLASLMGKKNAGVTHADDLPFIFESFQSSNMSENDMVTSQRIVNLWATFAKTRMPTPEVTELIPVKWAPLQPGETTYLNIDKELTLMDGFHSDKLRIWYDDTSSVGEVKKVKEEL